jgi:3-methylcrotonyl-CoA carboxylase alpha subunit
MFSKILMANRGEIACRIIRTARRMGVATVAVYSDADAGAMHVAMADEAVRIGPPPVAESYLDGERIVAAALMTGAEAIHPGYGFLSENPDFVDRVVNAGLIFIGPSATSIRAMGLKDAAKRLMEKAGVPVVPGYHGEAQDIVLLASKATEIGFPVLIKARAGGGGRGMRRVEHADDFAEALSSARREAKAAFGDDRVLVEKYVEKPRHIEVQVFGDNYGNVVHLFERDCSAQRRHQKVIEEAPAPGMTDEMRAAMTQAAVTAAKAISYSGAGTIEFIVDASQGLRPDRFWFMEMNTRLQVEHPVTEMITGVDLVEWQLRVACGEALPMRQDEIVLDGHAFEARLYAEDAAKGFLPATGTLHHLWFPDEPVTGTSLRVETGVREGDTISPFYDPMIAKLVVHGPDRETALDALGEMLAETEIAGSTVNTAFLAALAADPDFASGDVDTGLIGRKQDVLTAIPEPSKELLAAAALAVSGLSDTGTPDDPWSALAGYAHFHTTPKRIALRYGEREIQARAGIEAGKAFVELGGDDGKAHRLQPAMVNLARWPGHISVFDGPVSYSFIVPDQLDRAEEAGGGADSLRAPMPGLVKVVRAAAGDTVAKGQPLLVLEAMKMEHAIAAPHDGVIAEIASEGSQVTDGAVLVRFAEQGGE